MEKRDNSGALFTNDKREKETHPHYKGKATIGGVDYYVSGWIKSGQNGQYLSLSYKPIEEQSFKPQQNTKKDDFLF